MCAVTYSAVHLPFGFMESHYLHFCGPCFVLTSPNPSPTKYGHGQCPDAFPSVANSFMVSSLPYTCFIHCTLILLCVRVVLMQGSGRLVFSLGGPHDTVSWASLLLLQVTGRKGGKMMVESKPSPKWFQSKSCDANIMCAAYLLRQVEVNEQRVWI